MSPLLPMALKRPASITMMELSMGGRPVPSISRPPCTTSACSDMRCLPVSSEQPLFVLRDEDGRHLVDDRLRHLIHFGEQLMHRRPVNGIDFELQFLRI